MNLNFAFPFPMPVALDEAAHVPGHAGGHPHHLAGAVPAGGRAASSSPEEVFTHRLGLSDAAEAYRIFDAREDGVLKVLLDPTG